MAVYLRRLVSQQKRRFHKDGFDLDLAYITSRVIAMGLPAEGGEGFFRNPLQEIQRFLQFYHPKRHRVYNLCAERTYSPDKFLCDVVHYPFDDHQPPPLAMVNEFVNDAYSWLAEHPDNVIAVHCKAGKGRTGTMICCLLLYLGMQSPGLVDNFRLSDDAVRDVLHWYADKRTLNRKGITLQSQQRFVNYYYYTLQRPSRTLELIMPVFIQEIRIRNLPMHIIQSAMVTVYHRDNTRHTRPYVSGSPLRSALKAAACITGQADGGSASLVSLAGSREVLVSLAEQPALAGDIKLQLFRGSSSLFYTWFNTAFLPPAASTYTLTTPDLDRPSRDLPPNVTVEVIYHYPPAHPLTPRRDPPSPSSSRLMLLPAATATAHAAAAAESDIDPFLARPPASPEESSPSPPRQRPEALPSAAPPLVPRLPLNTLYTTAHPAPNLLDCPSNLPTPDHAAPPRPPALPSPPAYDDSVQVRSILSLRLPRPLISPLVSPRLPSPGTPPAHEPRAAGGLRTSSSTISLDEGDAPAASAPAPTPTPTPVPTWTPLALTLRPLMSGDPTRPAFHTAPAEPHSPPVAPVSARERTATLVLKPQLLYSCPVPPPPKKPNFLRALLNRFRPRKQPPPESPHAPPASEPQRPPADGADDSPMDHQQWQHFQQAWHTRWWMTLEEEDAC